MEASELRVPQSGVTIALLLLSGCSEVAPAGPLRSGGGPSDSASSAVQDAGMRVRRSALRFANEAFDGEMFVLNASTTGGQLSSF